MTTCHVSLTHGDGICYLGILLVSILQYTYRHEFRIANSECLLAIHFILTFSSSIQFVTVFMWISVVRQKFI
jgi:hypothetical protein